MLIDGRRVSFHTALRQLTSLNERWSLTELRVICTKEGWCRKLTLEPHFLILIYWNKMWKVKSMVNKWVVMKF
jgi:hypothetical protein